MKTSKLYFFVVAFLALSIPMVSCSGDDGEDGLTGPKGEQGVAGLVGSAGTDGSVIYSGEGEAAATVGITGDYYLDIATGMLYGPKQVDDSWADIIGFSLKGTDGADGADGADGTDGNETLSGNGEPTAEDGEFGDFYLDTETAILYGPKNPKGIAIGGTGWGAGLELKGADGNANVKSYVFSVLENEWLLNNDKTKLYAYELSSLSYLMTDDIIESGVVLVYRLDGSDHAILLPYSSKTNSGNLLTETFMFGGQDMFYMARELFTFANVEEELAKASYNYRAVIITGELASEVMYNATDEISFAAAALKMGIVE